MYIDLEYREKVMQLIVNMQVGEIFDIDKNVHPDRKNAFIQVIKDAIDDDINRENWPIAEFNNDFTKFKKIL